MAMVRWWNLIGPLVPPIQVTRNLLFQKIGATAAARGARMTQNALHAGALALVLGSLCSLWLVPLLDVSSAARAVLETSAGYSETINSDGYPIYGGSEDSPEIFAGVNLSNGTHPVWDSCSIAQYRALHNLMVLGHFEPRKLANAAIHCLSSTPSWSWGPDAPVSVQAELALAQALPGGLGRRANQPATNGTQEERLHAGMRWLDRVSTVTSPSISDTCST
jgi:hypothetical protein